VFLCCITGCDSPQPIAYSFVKRRGSSVGSPERVRGPEVILLKDAESYEKLCRESFPEYKKDSPEYDGQPPDPIDFEKYRVVGVFWGSKPNTSYDMSVLSVTAKGEEITITVKTTTPRRMQMNFQMVTYPSILMVIPKTDKVKVIVKGDSSDFANRKEDGLEVIVSRW
jgi:hypothetical protein